jgi:hypothetical protein
VKEEIKEAIKFTFGFMPWIVFLFISGHSFSSLERSLLISLAVCAVFGFQDLRRGFLLQWGTLLFFVASTVLVNGLKIVWIAVHMGILANAYLAFIMWTTIFIGKPFPLQYARVGLPKELWYEENVIRGCRFIALVWGVLMLMATGVSLVKYTHHGLLPEWIYFDISVGIIMFGIAFTSIYKHMKKKQRGASP